VCNRSLRICIAGEKSPLHSNPFIERYRLFNSNLEIPSILHYTGIMAALNQTERRIGISLFSGISITLVLTFLSTLAIRLFPYRDKPMMPKPFFLYAQAPGIIAGEWFAHGWIQDAVFFLTNSVAYAVAAFCVVGVIHLFFRRG
jgi:hypothetical protein